MKRTSAVVAGLIMLAASSCQQSRPVETEEYAIAVTDQGFEPAETKVPKGHPVTLVITRKTDQTCAKEVVFPSLDRRYTLPLNQPVRVTLPATQGGEIRYVCGMNMLGGEIVIK